MELRVLAVGDVVGEGGLQCLEQHLRSLKKLYRIDFCVVNGENASGTGLTPKQADRMLDAGADILTLGNHSFDRREICAYLDDCPYILRPANLLPSLPGRGFGTFETKIGPVGIVNLLGRCNLDFRPDNPFRVIDKVLKELDGLPENFRSVGHAHACADGGRADSAEGHRLSYGPRYDRPRAFRHRREAGAVYRKLPGGTYLSL